ncbi:MULTISPECIES: type I pullulanase [Lactobacillus]|uniref:pullulanase n=1 Tax=Lactobacillus xujianguonis TaxID=2495899 RepID=A0A437SVR9_9LACO|nr:MULTISPECIES: type I pullulanase [Lactobacillus]RVU71013.1 type I pullulanase [Lactobacillus xujianguonis]RVU73917.1 type I pullulanase [Lactobacillus xujianguonis]
MSKNSNHSMKFKSLFVCTSAIMSLWLGANLTSAQVHAADDNNTPAKSEVVQQASSAKSNTTDVKEQTTNQKVISPAIANGNQDNNSNGNQTREEVQDQTKIVIHYNGDGEKWVPYIWGKKPNGNGNEYKWDGKDDNGYYSVIDLDKNYDQVGVLIKTKGSWAGKDGTGADRSLDVSDNGKAEVFYKQGSDDAQKVTPKYHAADINLHYYGDDQVKSVTVWTDKDETHKQTINLTKNGNSKDGSFRLNNIEFGKLFVAPIGTDNVVREFTPLPGNKATDIYLVKNDSEAYYSKSFALADQSLSSAFMTSPNTLSIEAGKATTLDRIKEKLNLPNNSIASVEAIDPNADDKTKKFIIHTKTDLDILKNNQIGLGTNFKNIDIGPYIRSKAFDDKYAYDGDDLGCTYDSKQTQIKLWAPTAKNVKLNLYDSVDNNAKPTNVITMTRGDKGVWTSIIKGDKKGWAYDFNLTFGNGKVTQTDDPYSKAVTVNGVRSVIEDYNNIKPSDFNRMPSFSQPTDAIVYETSIRDFTSDPNSGIKDKGKFLGMIESGKTPTGQVTGLEYLKSLGITHVQIMPSYDFASIDETKSLDNQYNWGYDPKNYDVPEGSYSSDPTNPQARIMEMKEMINGLHKAGIRVIMDVVYNHVYNPQEQALELTVPGYYFRYDADNNTTGDSGCGNDIGTQRKMVRKYIVDSVVYWAKNYNLDGFRFDIMSLLDHQTMNDVRAALDKVDPGIITYGEGWELGNQKYTREFGTTQYTAEKVPGVGFFSDDMRNSVKGNDDGSEPGLVIGNGNERNFDNHAKLFTDSFLRGKWLHNDAWEPHNYATPSQMVNYAACHDGKTLYDYIKSELPNESDENIAKRVRLANSMIMLSQGISFFHSGQEALRTKDGNSNSYNSPVNINEINWERVGVNKASVEYFQKLAKLRKQLPILHLNDFNKIDNENVTKVISYGRETKDKNIKGVFEYEYNVDGKKLLIVFNVNNNTVSLDNIDLSHGKKLLDSDGNVKLSKETVLAPLSTLVVDEDGTMVLPKVPRPDQPEKPTTPSDNPTAPVKPTTPSENQIIPEEPIVEPEISSANDTKNNSINVINEANDSKAESTNVSSENKDKVLEVPLTHNAYVYDEQTNVVYKDGNKIVLKAGNTIKALDNGKKYAIKGKMFYKIAKGQFVQVANTISYYKLVHNSFVYSKQGKAIKKHGKRILLKKNKRILLRSNKIIKIKGKKFYQLKDGSFIKARNIKRVG